MSEILEMRPVAHIRNDFDSKFSIPRQPGLAEDILSCVTLEKEYQKDGVFRELEGFSHIWLIWGFTEFYDQKWSSTVRPPRLGGNRRVGVFASRSPHRPNPIAISAVRLVHIDGFSLIVQGADLMNGTPVYDIKPYLPYADCIAEASEGYAIKPDVHQLDVIVPYETASRLDGQYLQKLKEVLALDPRPAYIDDENRIYGFSFGGHEVKFKVKENVLHVLSID